MPLWTPSLLGPGSLRGWFKADAITGLSDGAAVASWDDFSGNSKPAFNTTGAEQPLYKTAIINGLPVVRFDGVDDDLTTTTPVMVKPCTVAFVARLTSAPPTGSARIYSQGSSLLVRASATDYQILGSTALNYHTGFDTNPHVHVLSWDTVPTSRCSFDGTAITGDAGNAIPGGSATFGSAGTSAWIGIDLAEMVMFNAPTTSADILRVEGYLAWKYALQANLPATHPYKSAAPFVAGSWSPGLLQPSVWFQADKITGLSDGAVVTSWADSGSMNTPLTNVTGVEQPLYKTAIQNGLPVVRFDGVNDDLTATGANANGICSVFLAFKSPADTTADQWAIQSSNNRIQLKMHLTAANVATMAQSASSIDYTAALGMSAWGLHALIYNGASSRGAFNGGTAVTGTLVGGGTAANLVVGGSGSANWADIDLAELLVILRAVTQAEEDQVVGYLAHKWGLTGVLPASHPYKSVAPTRGGRWTPAQMPALTTWLKADAITGLADNAPVATWTDSTGKGHDAVNAAGGTQPLYKVNVQNGLPAVRFDGIDDLLLANSGHGLQTQPCCIFFALKDNATGRIFQTATGPMVANVVGNDATFAAGTAVTYSAGGLAAHTWHTHVLSFNGAASIGSLDGVQVSGDVGTITGGSVLRIATQATGSFLAGDFGEIGILVGPVSVAEIQTLEGYLAWKWGLVANLPANHPYKAAPPTNSVSLTAGIV